MIKGGEKVSTDFAIVDVRDDDRIGGHIKGSLHQPSYKFLDEVQDLLEKVKDVPKVIFHCALSQQRYAQISLVYSSESNYTS